MSRLCAKWCTNNLQPAASLPPWVSPQVQGAVICPIHEAKKQAAIAAQVAMSGAFAASAAASAALVVAGAQCHAKSESAPPTDTDFGDEWQVIGDDRNRPHSL
tara:strand:- start:488 stop:796 length:309 start_codon:yes stop_codon:yes gene_type:complete